MEDYYGGQFIEDNYGRQNDGKLWRPIYGGQVWRINYGS